MYTKPLTITWTIDRSKWNSSALNNLNEGDYLHVTSMRKVICCFCYGSFHFPLNNTKLPGACFYTSFWGQMLQPCKETTSDSILRTPGLAYYLFPLLPLPFPREAVSYREKAVHFQHVLLETGKRRGRLMHNASINSTILKLIPGSELVRGECVRKTLLFSR